MSVRVALEDVDAVMRARGTTAYVVTVTGQATPHLVLAGVARRGRVLAVAASRSCRPGGAAHR